MSRNYFSDEFETLDLHNRLRDARIESTPVKDLPSLNVADMTIGEVITLANAIEAIRAITDYSRSMSVPDEAERPTPSPYASGGGFAPETRSQSAFSTVPVTDEDQADNGAAARLLSLLSGVVPQDYEVNTVNGPIKYSEIPRLGDGNMDPAWIDENCTCEDHERKRIKRDQIGAAENDGVPLTSGGMYL